MLPDRHTDPESCSLPRPELLFQQAARLVGLGAWSVELATGCLWWSEEVFRIHDMDPGAPPTLAEALAFYPEQARRSVETGLERLLREDTPYDIELPLITAKGRNIWTRALGSVERDAAGTPVRLTGVFTDITEQRRAGDALRESEQRMWLALRGNEDGVWDWNVAAGTVYFSERWKEILGYAPHQLEDSFETFSRLLHPEDLPRTLVEVDTVVSGRSDRYRVRFRMQHRDGTWRWILARARVFSRDAEGRARRIVGTHTDITDRVRTEDELIAAKAAAEAAARAKAEFLATMSHEIRTPLNGVLGMAQLLEHTQLDAQQAQMVETIQSSGRALLVILNDILDLSKIDAGRIELEELPTDLAALAQQVVELYSPQADERGLALGCEAEPALVLADPVRVRQILLNLVGNALKFTERGAVNVRLRTSAADDPSRVGVRIAVSDTGIGLSVDQRARLFEDFVQGDRTTTRRFGGTGLGLAICRRLAHLMGGTIVVASEPGLGSTFTLEVTFARADERPSAPPVEPRGAHRLTPLRALLVEDNTVNQLVARRMLEQAGCDVTVASDGAEALAFCEAQRFEVVFMDVQMPEMDGLEATRRLRAHERQHGLAPVPVIALTANAFDDDRAACAAAGMDGHLVKPIDRAELVRALAQVAHELDRSSGDQAAA